MTSSQEQERWEKNDQELKRLSKAIEAINQKTDERFAKIDERLAALMEGQTWLLEMLSNSGGNYKKQPQNRNQERGKTNLEWVWRRESEDRHVQCHGGCQEESNWKARRVELPTFSGQEVDGQAKSKQVRSKTEENHRRQPQTHKPDQEDTEKKKEKVKSIFQEGPELVPGSEENTIGKDVHEESIKAEDKGEEVRELDKCKVQLINEEEPLKSQDGGLRVVGKDRKRRVQIKRKKWGFQWKKKEGIKKQETMENKHQETRKRKTIKRYLKKNQIKKKKEKARIERRTKRTLRRNSIRMKVQERSKYTGRIFDAQVCSGFGDGPGKWRRNKGKILAAGDQVEDMERLTGKWRRLTGKGDELRLSFRFDMTVGLHCYEAAGKLSRENVSDEVTVSEVRCADDVSDGVIDQTMNWAAEFVTKKAAIVLKFSRKEVQNIISPRILKTFNPILSISTLISFRPFTPTHLNKSFNLKGNLKYLIGFIKAPAENDLGVDVNALTRVTFYPP